MIGVGVDTDLLYAPGEVRAWTDAYRAAGVDARYREIASAAGHDAFLIEWDQVEAILRERLDPVVGIRPLRGRRPAVPTRRS